MKKNFEKEDYAIRKSQAKNILKTIKISGANFVSVCGIPIEELIKDKNEEEQ